MDCEIKYFYIINLLENLSYVYIYNVFKLNL